MKYKTAHREQMFRGWLYHHHLKNGKNQEERYSATNATCKPCTVLNELDWSVRWPSLVLIIFENKHD